ncbi:MAG: InlB B-repeat-containing protein [Oscillospiraceae bacterium]|nr:InlB B-repeat-containing protein [Oscillospiraceae bacterium]
MSYQWQRSLDGGASWLDTAGETYSSLFVSATLSENKVLFRCVVTAPNGESLASDAALLTVPSSGTTCSTRFYLERTDGSGYDPTDQLVAEAAGSNVTTGVKPFEGYSENTAKGTHSGTVPTRQGHSFLGWAEKSTAAAARYQPGDSYTKDETITLYAVWQAEPVTVTRQPVSVTARSGDYVSYRVEATGENLRYQWQYWNGQGWANTGDDWNSSTDTMSFWTWPDGNGLCFRCVLWNDENGADWAFTETVGLTVS